MWECSLRCSPDDAIVFLRRSNRYFSDVTYLKFVIDNIRDDLALQCNVNNSYIKIDTSGEWLLEGSHTWFDNTSVYPFCFIDAPHICQIFPLALEAVFAIHLLGGYSKRYDSFIHNSYIRYYQARYRPELVEEPPVSKEVALVC